MTRMIRVAMASLVFAACDSGGTDPAGDVAPETAQGLPVVSPGLAGLEDRTAQPGTAPRISPGGGFRIEDAPPLTGDPDACAAFHACCDGVNGQTSPQGLACGLAPMVARGDCTRALESVRGIFREQKMPPPPGCS